MNKGDGKSYVEQVRSTWSADMVVLLAPSSTGGGVCGQANERFLDGSTHKYTVTTTVNYPWDVEEAYSVQKLNCGLNDLTFAHELGHNYGLRHDGAGTVSPQGIDDDPRGYVFLTAYGYRASLMGCVGGAAPCYRLAYYSDPNITVPMYGYEPTGSAGPPYHANAASVMRSRVSEYALFRSSED
jgi:hypothetical protein